DQIKQASHQTDQIDQASVNHCFPAIDQFYPLKKEGRHFHLSSRKASQNAT
ncbi:hypothetical protein GCK32_022610, partial [Trichostrongylus colubriformis]